MKRFLFLLILLPLRLAAQEDPAAAQQAVAEALPEAMPEKVAPVNKYFVPVDTIFRTNGETGEKVIKGYRPRAFADVYKMAITAYDSGQYAACHQYCWNEIQQGRVKGRQEADIYRLAMKSSYANRQYSSAIIYYQDMQRRGYRTDSALTAMAIFSYFPKEALQHQDHYNIYEKDTAFVLGLVNRMVKQDARWLMIRSKVYGAIADIDELEPEVRAAYRQKKDDELAAYTAQYQPDDWKELMK